MAEQPAFIPLCVPSLGGNDRRYVLDCLETGWVSSVGGYVTRFEKECAQRVGAARAVAATSGTAALHAGLLALGVGPDDEVVVSSLTFIAPVNAIRYTGAWPVLMDAEPVYWQMDVAKLADFLANGCRRQDGALVNRASGRRVRGILPVHNLGHPADLDPILELAREHGLWVLEDATECLGTLYRDQPLGAMGDAGVFSFNGNKVITTGGGGMLTTNRPELAERVQYLTTQAKSDPAQGVHGEVGYNYRLTNLQAALGCAQLELLDQHIAAKRRIAATYEAGLGDCPGVACMAQAPWAYSIYWMYTVRLDPARFGLDRRQLAETLAAQGIQTRPLWQPAHLSPAHQGAQAWDCQVAGELYDQCVTLPCSVGLAEADQARVIAAILDAGARARGGAR